MAVIANISINDGKTPTPTTHIFKPFTTNPEALYKRTDVVDQPAVAWESVVAKITFPAKPENANIATLQLVIPVLEAPTSSGAATGYVAPPKIAHELRFVGKFYMSNRSLTAQRTDLRVMVSNMLKDPQIADLLDNLTPPN